MGKAGILAPETYARKLASLSDTDFLSEEDIREIRRELLEHDRRLRNLSDTEQLKDAAVKAISRALATAKDHRRPLSQLHDTARVYLWDTLSDPGEGS